MESLTTHWDKIYNKTESSSLGWYEENFDQTIGFLNRISNWDTSTMFIAGAGSSKLADQLLHKNIKLILNDISSEAIKIIKDRIGENAAKIKWICQDNLVKKMTLNKTATIKFNKRNTSWGTLLISTFDFEPLICP